MSKWLVIEKSDEWNGFGLVGQVDAHDPIDAAKTAYELATPDVCGDGWYKANMTNGVYVVRNEHIVYLCVNMEQ